MSEEEKATPEVKPEVTPEETKKDLNVPLAVRTREDIYKRFDAKFEPKKEQQSGSSSVKEESNSDIDLKEASDSDQHTEKVLEIPEKPTSVKKGKVEPSEEMKTVPLQALHESRDRFKKLNLEYRDYKSNQDKEIIDLKSEIQKLHDMVKKSESLEDTTLGDISDDDPEKSAMKREIQELKKRYQQEDTQKAQQAQIEVQRKEQEKITAVSNELTTEGYPGFDIALLKTGAKLQELVKTGELTESEAVDTAVWKKVYKEHIFSDVKSIFNEQAKDELMEKKKAAKRKAKLVADPGKAPEQKSEEDAEPITYDSFVKQTLKERMDDQKKKFYKR